MDVVVVLLCVLVIINVVCLVINLVSMVGCSIMGMLWCFVLMSLGLVLGMVVWVVMIVVVLLGNRFSDDVLCLIWINVFCVCSVCILCDFLVFDLEISLLWFSRIWVMFDMLVLLMLIMCICCRLGGNCLVFMLLFWYWFWW